MSTPTCWASKNNIWALILPLAVSSFNVIICKTFFKSTIPDSIVESAKSTALPSLKIFFKIVLPVSLPVLATIGLFLCFTYWNDWFQSMLLHRRLTAELAAGAVDADHGQCGLSRKMPPAWGSARQSWRKTCPKRVREWQLQSLSFCPSPVLTLFSALFHLRPYSGRGKRIKAI